MFKDREDAGKKLAKKIEKENLNPDIILAIPRGALPLGKIAAEQFQIELDIIVASKIGAPRNPEHGIGAVTSHGNTWLNQESIKQLNIEEKEIKQRTREHKKKAQEKLKYLRDNNTPLKLEEKNVILIDDGIATGSTIKACLKQINKMKPCHVTVAVPVAPNNTVKELQKYVDKSIILETPQPFRSVGLHYKKFTQVTNDEAKTILQETNTTK